MPKSGHPLGTIPGFDSAVVAMLRDNFSVSTAEEFIGMWRSIPGQLSELLGGHKEASRLARLAESVISPEEMARIQKAETDSYPFRTGHESPRSRE